MIWAWIALAWLMTMLLLRNRHVRLWNYVWTLIPVDMYGISIAGATIKPYMLFAVAMVVISLAGSSRRRADGTRDKHGILHLAVLLFLIGTPFATDLLNGPVWASVAQHALFAGVVLIAYIYVSNGDIGKELEEILFVVTMTAIGYGLVFILAWMLFSPEVSGFDVYAMGRDSAGMILRYADMNSGLFEVSYRLRGFFNDPNPLVCMFAVPLVYGLVNLVDRGRFVLMSKRISVVAIAISFWCAYLTNSRMALLALLLGLMLTGYFLARLRGRAALFFLLGAVLVFIMAMLVTTGWLPGATDSLQAHFGYRAAFGDEYGRGTIWATCASLLLDGPLLTGFGQNQVQHYSPLGAPCHNTWLEWVCGTGLIVGMFVNTYFLYAPIQYAKGNGLLSNQVIDRATIAFLIAHVVVLIVLSSVDFISDTYLIFFTLMMYSMSGRMQGSCGKLRSEIDVPGQVVMERSDS